MAVHPFTLATLAAMDNGRISAAIQEEMNGCVADCRNRPAVKKARKVVIEIEFTPLEADVTQDLETVEMAVNVRTRHPTKKSRGYAMGVKKNGTLIFNDLSPHDIRQKTIDELTDE